MSGERRDGADVETIASGDPAATTVVPAGHAPARPGLTPVDPAHYRLQGELGEGGMGRVLLARDERLGRSVALKELHPGAGPGAPARFVREALVTARLQHPGVVPVYEAGTWPDGRPFYAMKRVEGRTLEAMLREAASLPARLALLPHLIAVAEAVAYAHSEGIVHRDLKPANVLVGAFGETVVVDWGLARDLRSASADEHAPASAQPAPAQVDGRTVVGTVLGTPHYMPPEQARGLPADERSDVYALGAMLYFLLAGAPPHHGKTSAEALAAAATGSVDPIERREPEAPRDLVDIVRKAIAPAPGERYPSARELAADLVRYQAGQLVSVHRYSAGELLRRFLRRHRVAVVVATSLGLALALAIAAGFLGVRRQARVAEAERDRARLAARKAEQTNAFLVGMLGSADPRVAGRDVTVSSVLDAASARVESELAAQPEAKAEVLTTLGTSYQGLGLYAPARERLAAALAAKRAAYGPEHMEVARALDRLAGAAEDEGELREAERLGREAKALIERLGETAGADAAQVDGNLARVLEKLGNGAEAEALYRQVLAVERRLDGRGASVAATLNNLGVLLGNRDDWASAELLHREALEIVRAASGPRHPDVAAAMSSLGTALESKGDLAAAEALYREALALRLQVLGPDHPDVARSRYALAGLLRARGAAQGALDEARLVLKLRGRGLPEGHPMVAAALQVAGLSLVELGRPREAEPLLRDSLALRRESLPAGHWLVASSESALGACLTAEGRYAEAESLLRRALAALESSRGHDHARTVEARQRLAALREARSRAGR